MRGITRRRALAAGAGATAALAGCVSTFGGGDGSSLDIDAEAEPEPEDDPEDYSDASAEDVEQEFRAILEEEGIGVEEVVAETGSGPIDVTYSYDTTSQRAQRNEVSFIAGTYTVFVEHNIFDERMNCDALNRDGDLEYCYFVPPALALDYLTLGIEWPELMWYVEDGMESGAACL